MTFYDIIKKPIITEKSELLRRNFNRYTFEVDKAANKVEIREAVEIMGKHQVGLNLSNQQIDEIVEFLKTLEGNIVDYTKDEAKK